jgi:hypothetical protein
MGYHQGIPFPDFSIFSSLCTFFGNFLYKIGIYDPNLAYLKTQNPTINLILNPTPKPSTLP